MKEQKLFGWDEHTIDGHALRSMTPEEKEEQHHMDWHLCWKGGKVHSSCSTHVPVCLSRPPTGRQAGCCSADSSTSENNSTTCTQACRPSLDRFKDGIHWQAPKWSSAT